MRTHRNIRTIVVATTLQNLVFAYAIERLFWESRSMNVLLPWLGRFLLTISRINRMNEPVEDHLRAFTANQSLIDIIGQHFFRNTPAFFAMETFCVEHGVEIARGTRIDAVDTERRTVGSVRQTPT